MSVHPNHLVFFCVTKHCNNKVGERELRKKETHSVCKGRILGINKESVEASHPLFHMVLKEFREVLAARTE